MSDTFTLLTPAVLAASGSFSAASAVPVSSGTAESQPISAQGHASVSTGNCAAKPTVTLQRKGNVVSSIRIQCACGQVIELNCQY